MYSTLSAVQTSAGLPFTVLSLMAAVWMLEISRLWYVGVR